MGVINPTIIECRNTRVLTMYTVAYILYFIFIHIPCVVPMKEPVGKASTQEIIYDKKHEITREGMLKDKETSVAILFVSIGMTTESPPLKNWL